MKSPLSLLLAAITAPQAPNWSASDLPVIRENACNEKRCDGFRGPTAGDPVEIFSRKMSVNIPLITYKSARDANLEIALSYSGSSELSGFYGAKWDLNVPMMVMQSDAESIPNKGKGPGPVWSTTYVKLFDTLWIENHSIFAYSNQNVYDPSAREGGNDTKIRYSGITAGPNGYLLPGSITQRFSNGIKRIFTRLSNYPSARYRYGAEYLLTEVQFPNGGTQRYQYGFVTDSIFRLSSIIDSSGKKIVIEYNSYGSVEKIKDFTDREFNFEYEQNTGMLSKIQFPLGREIGVHYNNSRQIKKIISPNEMAQSGLNGQASVENFYDSSEKEIIQQRSGGVVNGRIAGGLATFLKFSEPQGLTNKTAVLYVSPGGRSTLTLFDEQKRQEAVWDFSRKLDPNDSSLPQKTFNQLFSGNLADFNNSLSLITSNPKDDPTSPESFNTRFQYNTLGLIIQTKDPSGSVTNSVYNTGSPDNFKKRLLVKQITTPPSGVGSRTVEFDYEPLFNKSISSSDPRPWSPGFQPQNGGPATQARYITKTLYDCQELTESTFQSEATTWGIELSNQTLRSLLSSDFISAVGSNYFGLGDLNGDGVPSTCSGNAVAIISPTTNVPVNTSNLSAGYMPVPVVERNLYNSCGLLKRTIDSIGRETSVLRYSEKNPTGSLAGTESGYSTTEGEDGCGLPKEVVQPNGGVSMISYNAFGIDVQTTGPRGRVESKTINDLMQVIASSSGNGADVIFEYDYNGNKTAEEKKICRYTFTANYTPSSVRICDGKIRVETQYDILDNPIRVSTKGMRTGTSDIEQVAENYYNRDNLLAVEKSVGAVSGLEPNNMTFHRYDALSRPFIKAVGKVPTGFYDQYTNQDLSLSANDPYAGEGKILYDFTTGRVKKTISPLGETIENQYDDFGNVKKTFTSDRVTIVNEYDAAGNLIGVTLIGYQGKILKKRIAKFDELNRKYGEEIFVYDSNGVFQRKALETIQFTASGKVKEATDSVGVKVTNDFDQNGNISRTFDSKGNQTLFGYNIEGLVNWSQTQLSGQAPTDTWVFYDATGAKFATTNSILQTSRVLMDTDGRVQLQSDAKSATLVPLASLDLFSEFTTLPQNALTNEHGNRKAYEYDVLGRLKNEIQVYYQDGIGGNNLETIGITSFEYNLAGRAFKTTDANSNQTTTQFDAMGRTTAVTFPNSSYETANTFNAIGNPLTGSDRLGNQYTFHYDVKGRLVQKNIQKANGVHGSTFEIYSYNERNQLVGAIDQETTVTINRGEGDEVYSSQLSFGGTTYSFSVQKNSWGGIDRIDYPSGASVHTTFDGEKNPKTYRWGADALPFTTLNYQPGTGRVENQTYSSGVQTSFGYDTLNRPTSITASVGSESFTSEWGYDRAGNRTYHLETLSNHPTLRQDYFYDSTNRLKHSQWGVDSGGGLFSNSNVTYAQDLMNNRTSVSILGSLVLPSANFGVGSYQSGEQNQYTTTPFGSNDFNLRGDMTRLDQRAINIEWNWKGLPVKFTLGNQDTVELKYDVLGRRIQKILQSAQHGTKVTTYIPCLASINTCEQIEADGSTSSYAYTNHNAPTVSKNTQTGNRFYLTDSLGSVKLVLNNSGGIVSSYAYTDYGDPLNRLTLSPTSFDLSLNQNDILFTGQRYDRELGLYDYRARIYDSKTGRFLSQDPLPDLNSSGSSYDYVSSNPVGYVDPTGNFRAPPTSGGIGGPRRHPPRPPRISIGELMSMVAGDAEKVWKYVNPNGTMGGAITTAAKYFSQVFKDNKKPSPLDQINIALIVPQSQFTLLPPGTDVYTFNDHLVLIYRSKNSRPDFEIIGPDGNSTLQNADEFFTRSIVNLGLGNLKYHSLEEVAHLMFMFSPPGALMDGTAAVTELFDGEKRPDNFTDWVVWTLRVTGGATALTSPVGGLKSSGMKMSPQKVRVSVHLDGIRALDLSFANYMDNVLTSIMSDTSGFKDFAVSLGSNHAERIAAVQNWALHRGKGVSAVTRRLEGDEFMQMINDTVVPFDYNFMNNYFGGHGVYSHAAQLMYLESKIGARNLDIFMQNMKAYHFEQFFDSGAFFITNPNGPHSPMWVNQKLWGGYKGW